MELFFFGFLTVGVEDPPDQTLSRKGERGKGGDPLARHKKLERVREMERRRRRREKRKKLAAKAARAAATAQDAPAQA